MTWTSSGQDGSADGVTPRLVNSSSRRVNCYNQVIIEFKDNKIICDLCHQAHGAKSKLRKVNLTKLRGLADKLLGAR